MKKIVSFFGERSEVFTALNQKAQVYANACGFSYLWAPQQPFSASDVAALLRQADCGIIDIEPYGEEIFQAIGPRPKLLVRFGVGYDKVDLPAASRHGIAIARTTGANTLGVAELALGMILATRRRLHPFYRQVMQGQWEKTVVQETVGGTVGIVGFGAVGQALASLLQSFDCTILAYDPKAEPSVAGRYGAKLVPLDQLLRTSDAISLHVPYSEQTHHLINAQALRKMKPGAVVVNTSRGNVVDEDALCDALEQRIIAGAALDVYAHEPLAVTSRLLKQDNILLTPHIASQTEESLWRIYKMAIDIAADFFAGKPCPHILNPEFQQFCSSASTA